MSKRFAKLLSLRGRPIATKLLLKKLMFSVVLCFSIPAQPSSNLKLCGPELVAGFDLVGDLGLSGGEGFTGLARTINIYSGENEVRGMAFLKGILEVRFGPSFKPRKELILIKASKILGSFDSVRQTSVGYKLVYSDGAVKISDFNFKDPTIKIIDIRRPASAKDLKSFASFESGCKVRPVLDKKAKDLTGCFAGIKNSSGQPSLFMELKKDRIVINRVELFKQKRMEFAQVGSIKNSQVFACLEDVLNKAGLPLAPEIEVSYELSVDLSTQNPEFKTGAQKIKEKFKLRD